MKKQIVKRVQVNIPFRMLIEDYLDLFIEYGLNPEIGIDADALDNYSVSDVAKVISPFHRNERRITVHGPFLDLSPGSSDPAIRDVTRRRLEQVLELVPILKPKTVVCHAGYEEDRYSFFYRSWLKKSLEMWGWFGEKLLEAGTVLMLENVYEKKPAEIFPFLSGLQNLKVGCCFDIGHQFVFGKVSLDSWIDMLGPYIGQLHLHDNSGSKDEHLPLGSGKIDFYPLIGFLKKRKKLPLITLEPHKEADLWLSMEYLSRMFGDLGIE